MNDSLDKAKRLIRKYMEDEIGDKFIDGFELIKYLNEKWPQYESEGGE